MSYPLEILHRFSGRLHTLSLKRPTREKLVLWVTACNRAGKTTVLNTLRGIPGSCIYDEGSAVAYHNYRIKPLAEIAGLISSTNRDLIIFELANDLQYTDAFLNLHPISRAFWILRNYRGVVRDAVHKWGAAQRDMMVGIGQGVCKHAGQQAIAELMTPETFALVQEFSGTNPSPEDGAALLWYTRNQMYFQLGLDKDPRVLLVQHEDLVAHPGREGQRMFEFIGRDFREDFVKGIDRSRISVESVDDLNPRIRGLCDSLLERLQKCYAEDRPASVLTG